MNEMKRNLKWDNDDVIDLRPLVKALWKGAWLILSAGLFCGCAAYALTKTFVDPTYCATLTVYVNNRGTDGDSSITTVNSSDVTAAKELANAYANILSSRTVLTRAADLAGVNYSDYEALREVVSATVASDTEIIDINVVLDTPRRALDMARALSVVAPEYISTVIEGSSMRIIDSPILPKRIYSPSYFKRAVLGVLLGALLVSLIIVLRELMDDRVKDEEDLSHRYGLTILGSIPNLKEASAAESRGGYDRYAYGPNRDRKKKG